MNQFQASFNRQNGSLFILVYCLTVCYKALEIAYTNLTTDHIRTLQIKTLFSDTKLLLMYGRSYSLRISFAVNRVEETAGNSTKETVNKVERAR